MKANGTYICIFKDPKTNTSFTRETTYEAAKSCAESWGYRIIRIEGKTILLEKIGGRK